jgi:NRPS condensation-like uncharacterized protein
MLQWSELHPYNAAHTYQLSGPLNLPALQKAVREALEHNNLGIAEIDPAGVEYHHEADDSPQAAEVELVAGDGLPEDRLAVHLARQLNRPFDRPRCRPFRFSVVDAGPTSHYVSLTYDHWVADSVGARLLMRHVLGRYLKLDIPANQGTLELYPGTYREVFADRLSGSHLALPVLRSIRSLLNNRSAWRVAYASVSQMAIGYGMYAMQPGTVQKVRRFARASEASVNDVFLAVLARALADFLPRRSAKAGASQMALGSIVDTRGDAGEDLSESLGTFLGYFVTRVADDRAIGLDELTRRIAATTRVQKAQRSYLDSAVNYRVASAIWPRLKPESRLHFARRALPLTAGISNVYLRGTWIDQQGAGRILDVRRAVSNGPTLPLVVSPTTLGEKMNVAVSYRLTGFSQAKIDGIMQSFVEQLETLDGQAAGQTPARVFFPAVRATEQPQDEASAAA